MLESAPERIATATGGATPEQLQMSPEQGAWSANQVLAHLRSCADVWGACIGRILAEDHPTIQTVHPNTWIKQTNYPDHEFHDSLISFTQQRSELLEILEQLPPDSWTRGATVIGTGKPREHTVFMFARRMALHECEHFGQIERVIQSVRS
jgi:hypothetical protein